MQHTRWHFVWLVVATVVFPLSAAHAQDWELFENVCNATEESLPGSPIPCITALADPQTGALTDYVVATATNSSDRRSYSTQIFFDLDQHCLNLDYAHPWYDEVKGLCEVEVYWLEPTTGVSSSLWVGFGDPLEHGEASGWTGLSVYVESVSCSCYGRRR